MSDRSKTFPMELKFPHLCLIFDSMISRFTIVAIATLTLLSSFVWADDDKEISEVRLAAIKRLNISLLPYRGLVARTAQWVQNLSKMEGRQRFKDGIDESETQLVPLLKKASLDKECSTGQRCRIRACRKYIQGSHRMPFSSSRAHRQVVHHTHK